MKKAFFTLAAALLVLSGCQNDEVLESAVKAQQKAVLTATIPGKTTKVSYEEVLPEEEEIENTSLKAAWMPMMPSPLLPWTAITRCLTSITTSMKAKVARHPERSPVR